MNPTDAQTVQAGLQTLIAATIPVIVTLIFIYGKVLEQRARAQLTAQQLTVADMLISRFVAAAQQYDLTGAVIRSATEKKAWVVQRAQEELDKRKMPIDVAMLADLVEASILKGAKEPINLGALPASAKKE